MAWREVVRRSELALEARRRAAEHHRDSWERRDWIATAREHEAWVRYQAESAADALHLKQCHEAIHAGERNRLKGWTTTGRPER